MAMFMMGPAEILLLMLLSLGGRSADLVSLLDPRDYFKHKGIEVNISKMVELAANEPKTGADQIAQLLISIVHRRKRAVVSYVIADVAQVRPAIVVGGLIGRGSEQANQAGVTAEFVAGLFLGAFGNSLFIIGGTHQVLYVNKRRAGLNEGRGCFFLAKSVNREATFP